MRPEDQSQDQRISIARLNDMSQDDFVEAVSPVSARATGSFNSRGGIRPMVEAGYENE